MLYKCMKLMSEYNEKLRYVRHFAEKCDLGTWPEMTSAVEHSQCLLINFNIFNCKKNCVA